MADMAMPEMRINLAMECYGEMNEMTWHPDIPEEYRNQIVCGDARILAERIPNESIDLIICDPEYAKIDDYRWLAELALRVLKQGGNCIAQYAHFYQIETLNAMSKYLDFVWPLTEFLWGGNATFWANRIIVKTKPYAWFSKGKRKGGFVFDVLKGGGISKQFHQWGDSPDMFLSLVDKLTEKNEIILDPFTGGGVVPSVCKILAKNYIAFEINPETAQIARQRLIDTPNPLPLEMPKQEILL